MDWSDLEGCLQNVQKKVSFRMFEISTVESNHLRCKGKDGLERPRCSFIMFSRFESNHPNCKGKDGSQRPRGHFREKGFLNVMNWSCCIAKMKGWIAAT